VPGQRFAGGRGATPFGTIFSRTSRGAETGSAAAGSSFRRALAGRDRRAFYPTFPYDHFTNVSDDDDHAL